MPKGAQPWKRRRIVGSYVHGMSGPEESFAMAKAKVDAQRDKVMRDPAKFLEEAPEILDNLIAAFKVETDAEERRELAFQINKIRLLQQMEGK
jgi:predicted lipid-binding transport protein (Tim44 family)